MDFKADLKDVRFVLFDYLKAQDLSKSERFEEANQELMEMVIDEALKFSTDVMAPENEEADKLGCKYEGGQVYLPPGLKKIMEKVGENGWGAMIEDPVYGGQGLPEVLSVAANEFFIGACGAISLLPMLTSGAAHLIEHFGSDELKETYLEKMYSLEWAGTMCLTEPQAGSDVGNSKTKAIKQNDGTYKIMGTKNFITGGDHDFGENIIHLVLARTEGAPKGTKGLSLFVVPKFRVENGENTGVSNDVACAGIEHKMGINGSPTCTMNFGENEDCYGYMLGEEGRGMPMMFHLMNEARIWVGIQGFAAAAASYQQTLEYARERFQGSDIREFKNPDAPRVPIIAHPDVRRMLMTMKARVEGLRSLMYYAGHLQDLVKVTQDDELKEKYQDRVDLLTPVCKAYGSDIGFEMTSVGVQVLGGYGYTQDYPQEQFMRDSRISMIYEGANGIQAMDLFARKLSLKKGALFAGFQQEVLGFTMKQKSREGDVGATVELLGTAIRTLGKTTMQVGGMARKDLALGILQATPYLRMFGHVACGYEMAKQAVLSEDKLNALYQEHGAADDEAKQKLYDTNAEAYFLRNKLYTARFYAENVLPEVDAIAKTITSGDRSALDLRFTMEPEFE